jgi:hypothetical protein
MLPAIVAAGAVFSSGLLFLLLLFGLLPLFRS